MAKMYYDGDADLGLLSGRKVAVIGYGSQGHAHALNLKDSGVDVVVGLPPGSRSRTKAQADGLAVKTPAEAAAEADVVMILTPDTGQAKLFRDDIAPGLKPGKTLMFAHGFNIRFGTITAPPGVDVSMVAPKAPGHRVREVFKEGQGTPGLLAVHQDASGKAKAMALAYAKGNRDLFPFFWIEPMERDAVAQVDRAIAMGASGFKVIVTNYPPYHPKAMKVYRRIAARGKPLLFHTGILWDGTASSINNRPANWECMLDVPGIRFATAHISWPWVDENIAVYGKIQAALRRGARASCEMFIDTTRGTPDIYRREALFKVYKVGYRVEHNVFFGTDNLVDRYDVPRARKMVRDDTRILKALRVPPKVRAAYYADNLRRFVEG